MSDRRNYTRAEAQALIGKTYESRVKFSGVPKGTRGRVIAIDKASDGYDVVIEWDIDYRLPSGQGLRDWFTREEMERFMQEHLGKFDCLEARDG